MKICPRCDTPVQKNRRFCGQCGYDLNSAFQNNGKPADRGARNSPRRSAGLRRGERTLRKRKNKLKKKTPSLWFGITILLLGILVLGVALKVSWIDLSAGDEEASYGIDMEKTSGSDGAKESLPDYWEDVSSLSIFGGAFTILLGTALVIISSLKYVYEEKRELFCIFNMVCAVIAMPFNLLVIYVGAWFNGLSISDMSSGETVSAYNTPAPIILIFLGMGLLFVSMLMIHFESKYIFKRSKVRKLEKKISHHADVTRRRF